MSTEINIGQLDTNLTRFGKVKKLGITSYTARKYEPQTQNTFAFEFLFDPWQIAYIAAYANNMISPITGAEAISTNNYSQGLADINETLNSSMQSLTSPTKNIGQIVMDFFNTQIKYAGKPTYTNANITLNTLIGLGSKNVLAAWSDICLNERTNAGGWARTLNPTSQPRGMGDTESWEKYLEYLAPNVGYKVDGVMLECARDGSIVNMWQYIGMWVSSFTPGNYTMAGANTPSQVTATISVDKIQQADEKIIRERILNQSYRQYDTSI